MSVGFHKRKLWAPIVIPIEINKRGHHWSKQSMKERALCFDVAVSSRHTPSLILRRLDHDDEI